MSLVSWLSMQARGGEPRPTRRPFRHSAQRSTAPGPALLLCGLLLASASMGVAETQVIHALIDPTGLPPLHRTQEDGEPFMWLPQFRLFDAAGRPLWAFERLPPGFRRELERRIEASEPLEEERTFDQEARFLLRRGGLPLNLTTVPASDLTIIEYWTNDCGLCAKLSREVDKFFRRNDEMSVKIFRVFIELGGEP